MSCKKTALFALAAILMLLEGTAFAQSSTLYNYNYVHRGVRSLGMGGAFTAVPGDSEGIFYNPATLYDMKFGIQILNPLVEEDKNALDIQSDLTSALDKDTDAARTSALTEVIQANQGKPLHGRASLFPHVAWKSFVVGALGQGAIDARLHNPLSSSGAVEVDTLINYGPVGAFSMSTPWTGFRVGAGAKAFQYTYVNQSYTVNEFSNPNFDAADDVKSGSAAAIDVGGLYDFQSGFLASTNTRLGVSFMNIGGLDMGPRTKIPMTVNVGISAKPKLPFGTLLLAADVHDIGFAYEEDKSLFKRLHIGGEFGILSDHITVNVGLNQGYGSYGFRFDLWVIKFAYAYYTEEMGAYSGQDSDARHVLQISIGW